MTAKLIRMPSRIEREALTPAKKVLNVSPRLLVAAICAMYLAAGWLLIYAYRWF